MSKERRKRLKKIGLITLFVIVGAFTSLFLYLYYATHSSSVTFQLYEPAYLPDDIRMTNRKIEIRRDKTNPLFYHRSLAFEFSKPNVIIGEAKFNGFTENCGPSIADNQTCIVEESPSDRHYTLITTRDHINGEINSQRVIFLIGWTHIWMEFQGSPLEPYPVEEWDKMVDSFQPANYRNLPVERYAPGP